MKSLIDKYGRKITSLRISVTNRCNLNCIYCHNEGENKKTKKNKEIANDTIAKIVHVATQYGVDKVKFSGGEPLMREDLEEIIIALPALKDVSITTNGILLAKRASDLADAGLSRANISLDTLDLNKYNKITGNKNPNTLSKVIDGIYSAIDAKLTPVKINMVLLKGINTDEIWNMIEFAKSFKGKLILQLIELMDFKKIPQYKVNFKEIESRLELRANNIITRNMHHRKKYLMDGVEVEVVHPIDNSEFCANCNRLRITSDGKLKPCLLRNNNLLNISNASDKEMHDLLKIAVNQREPYYKPNP
ncbi:MAG: GTP 3',8-cyclase MoaA [Methanosarcinales archaeon]